MAVQLIRLDPAIEEELANDEEHNEALVQEDWSRMAAAAQRVVGRTLVAAPTSIDELRWEGYFVIDEDTLEVVGSCAFKGPPTDEGVVEIAYFTYPAFEGRGYATEMARKLLELAGGSADVRQVIAHTLQETNASTRVLEKVGMTFVGEVMDPEDGLVWKWQTAPTELRTTP